jgi:tetratricopeptide (TPR) repeat protein
MRRESASDAATAAPLGAGALVWLICLLASLADGPSLMAATGGGGGAGAVPATESVTVAAAGPGSAPSVERDGPLQESEVRGYQGWLQSLTASIAARQKAGAPENAGLYPLGELPLEDRGIATFRQISISRALSRLEVNRRPGQNVADISAFSCLAMARNYLHLAEYDSALVWYDRASRHDTDDGYAAEIGRESLAAATMRGDSLSFVGRLLNTLGASDLAGREEELILAYRYLLVRQDGSNLRHLLKKVSLQISRLSPRLRYWHAWGLITLKEWEPALRHLRVLVATGGLSHGLTEEQRGYVLTALPDLLVLLDRRPEARRLYRLLIEGGPSALQPWAEYQVAGLNLLDGHYLQAWLGYRRLCERDPPPDWREQACELLELADELQTIRKEGERYGTAALDRR